MGHSRAIRRRTQSKRGKKNTKHYIPKNDEELDKTVDVLLASIGLKRDDLKLSIEGQRRLNKAMATSVREQIFKNALKSSEVVELFYPPNSMELYLRPRVK